MENYKAKVGSEAKSKEVQELLFELGYKWFSGGNQVQHLKQSCSSSFGYLVAWSTGCFTNVIQCGCGDEDAKEITIPQLKDMVVLKRNDPKDENVYQDGDAPCLYNLYLTSDKNLYFFSYGKGWKLSAINDDDYRKLLKPITKEPVMKEYLVKNQHDEYVFLNDVSCVPSEFVIEVPEGMNYAYKDEFNIHFTKLEMGYRDSIVLWQRSTKPETLPFIDDEPKYDPEDIKIAKGYDLDELAKEYKFRDRYDGETDEDYRAMLEQRTPKETLNDKVASAELARQESITPFDTQISGDHYKLLPIQPMKFCLANGLDYAQGNVIKYVIRHASKNGKDDLLKAIHNIELMIEHYYGDH